MGLFKLHSEYAPTGDQPKAIADLVGSLRAGNRYQTLLGVTGSGKGPGGSTGVWVINKQLRRKRAGQRDDLTVTGTYFVVGENIYQAPSVLDIVQNRLS